MSSDLITPDMSRKRSWPTESFALVFTLHGGWDHSTSASQTRAVPAEATRWLSFSSQLMLIITEDFEKFDEEQHTFFIIRQLLSKAIEELVAERGRLILGAKLEGCGTKSFIFSLFTI